MRRRMIDAILKAHTEFSEPNTNECSDNHQVQILCSFRLGDLRNLKKEMAEHDKLISSTTAA